MRIYYLLILTFFLPVVADAESHLRFSSLVKKVVDLINVALPIVGGLIVLAFMWGVLRYVFSNSGEKAASKAVIIWGLIGIFVTVSIWGIIALFRTTLGAY